MNDEQGGDVVAIIQSKNKLSELKSRAIKRKQSPALRHVPDKADVKKVNENTELLSPHQLEILNSK